MFINNVVYAQHLKQVDRRRQGMGLFRVPNIFGEFVETLRRLETIDINYHAQRLFPFKRKGKNGRMIRLRELSFEFPCKVEGIAGEFLIPESDDSLTTA